MTNNIIPIHAKQPIRLGVLISGRGSNLKAIIEAIEAQTLRNTTVGLVIANNPEAGGLALAKQKGISTETICFTEFETRHAYDQAILLELKQANVDLVILAGYDKIITDVLLKAYPNRILNIHPSLLPAYGGKGMLGMKVHEAVLKNNETQSGCSVHTVTAVVDGGKVLGQATVEVCPGDTPEQLAARVLEQEHQLYPQVIQQVVDALLSQTVSV